MNPLESSGKPLFFKVRNAGQAGLEAPSNLQGVAIRTTARSLSVMQKEAFVTSSRTGTTWRLASDEGAYLMGDDAAPCPLAFMTAGMVASFMDEIRRLARERDVSLGILRLVQDNYYTMEGSALRGTMVGGALPVELSVETDSPLPEDRLRSLVRDGIRRSPAHGLITSVLNSRFTLSHNGSEIPTGKVRPIGRQALAWSDTVFDESVPADADSNAIVTRNGMSPADEATSSAGSSYADEQSRRLHVRGICTLRPDGTKAIEQQLLNPHGSIFHFLSEEGGQDGGAGRAPDAMSYLSAGIAFCFMTQFGRYAKIVKKNLQSYAIIQDTHFSAPGSAAGAADPVETHVYLETGEDDDFARTGLDISERTCFLHALCRSEFRVNVKIARMGAGAGGV